MAIIGVDNVCTVDCCYVHFLAFYEGKCCSTHGHTSRVSVVICGTPDKSGMVIDFVILKKVLKNVLDEWLDHKLIVSSEYAKVKDESVEIEYTTKVGRHYMLLPKSEVTIIEGEPLAETLSNLVAEKVLQKLPRSVTSVFVTLTEGLDNYAVGKASRS